MEGVFLFYRVFKPEILIVNTLRVKYCVRDRSKLPCSADSPARRARHSKKEKVKREEWQKLLIK